MKASGYFKHCGFVASAACYDMDKKSGSFHMHLIDGKDFICLIPTKCETGPWAQGENNHFESSSLQASRKDVQNLLD